jgi:Holliday junction DNA helicase, RuvA subunit
MYDYINGEIAELTPAYVVIDVAGLGYLVNITLPTYTALNGKTSTKLFVYEVIREDAYLLFGFTNTAERQLFLHLISVSGIGANTARMIMSAYSMNEIQEMIATGNVVALNAIKGIGTKTAQRIIVDLKDKILKMDGVNQDTNLLGTTDNEIRNEAVQALAMLGFAASASQKAVTQILKSEPNIKLEQLIKLSLKIL